MKLILWLPFYEKNKAEEDLIISGMSQDLHSKDNVLLNASQDHEISEKLLLFYILIFQIS